MNPYNRVRTYNKAMQSNYHYYMASAEVKNDYKKRLIVIMDILGKENNRIQDEMRKTPDYIIEYSYSQAGYLPDSCEIIPIYGTKTDAESALLDLWIQESKTITSLVYGGQIFDESHPDFDYYLRELADISEDYIEVRDIFSEDYLFEASIWSYNQYMTRIGENESLESFLLWLDEN